MDKMSQGSEETQALLRAMESGVVGVWRSAETLDTALDITDLRE